MNVAQNILNDLRAKRLWPIAAALLLALIAIPVLLSSPAKPAPLAHATPPFTPVTSNGVAIPTLSVEAPPTLSRLNEAPRDPFTQQLASTTTSSSSSSGSSGSGSSVPSSLAHLGSASASTGSGSGAASSGSGPVSPALGAGSTGATAPLAPTPPATVQSPAPAQPSGLSGTQAYHVALSITNASGGLDVIDPLERLSVLPNAHQPLLVELGVLQGGSRVVFAVQPGTVVSGPGSCTPGPIDCEVVSLAPGQTEAVSQQTPTGSTPVAEFAVNSISAADHPTVAAAEEARRTASDAGRQLLANSPLSTGSLFQYDPSVGAVVDLRNLTVGGN